MWCDMGISETRSDHIIPIEALLPQRCSGSYMNKNKAYAALANLMTMSHTRVNTQCVPGTFNSRRHRLSLQLHRVHTGEVVDYQATLLMCDDHRPILSHMLFLFSHVKSALVRHSTSVRRRTAYQSDFSPNSQIPNSS
jgi:hypothetical protein